MSLREQALSLAERGWPVFPIKAGQKNPPVVKFGTEATTDRQKVEKWWRSDSSKRNIGIRTGDGLVVLDLDVKADGPNSLIKLLHERQEVLPDTYAVKTHSGGAHYYFKTNRDIRNSASRVGPGIDVRGHNGFVVAAGSYIEETNAYYECVADHALAELPEWLADLMEGDTPTAAVEVDDEQPLIDVPKGARNDRLFKEAAGLRGKGWQHDAIRTAIGERNKQFTEPLDDSELDLIASQAAKYTPNSQSFYDDQMQQLELAKHVEKIRTEPHPDEQTRPLKLKGLSRYDARKVNYLWQGWFPLNSVSIVAGDPGQAKTSFLLKMASAVTTGGKPYPNAEPTPKGSVVFATAEDSIEHTILPRVMAAGGDPSKFYIVENVDFDMVEQRDEFMQAIRQLGDVRMVIIDPITAYMSKGSDGNSNVDVRIALRSLTDVAEDLDLAIIGISHLNKDTRKSVFARLLGSVGWVAAPRAVYLVAENPELPGQSVVACAKTNFAPPEPLAFRKAIVEVDTLDGPADQVVTEIEDYAGTMTIDQLFAAKDNKPKATDAARRWLRERIAPGEWVPAADLEAEVQAHALFSWRIAKDAKKQLPIESKKKDNVWYWVHVVQDIDGQENDED